MEENKLLDSFFPTSILCVSMHQINLEFPSAGPWQGCAVQPGAAELLSCCPCPLPGNSWLTPGSRCCWSHSHLRAEQAAGRTPRDEFGMQGADVRAQRDIPELCPKAGDTTAPLPNSAFPTLSTVSKSLIPAKSFIWDCLALNFSLLSSPKSTSSLALFSCVNNDNLFNGSNSGQDLPSPKTP